ncbi:MAG: hypothetical protein AB1507_02625 [Bacillota bacterium]|jgi:ribosome-binding protein aMBF1 (putative translation factor)|nr:hypothetical protein [Thermoanaerobacteraceae bacterium]
MNRKWAIIGVAITAAFVFLVTNLNLNPAGAYPNMGSNCAGCHGGKTPGTTTSTTTTKPTTTTTTTKTTTTKTATTKTTAAKPAVKRVYKQAIMKKMGLSFLGTTGEVNVAVIDGRAYISARDLTQLLGAQAGVNKDATQLTINYPPEGATSCKACHPDVSSALPGVPCEACHSNGAAHMKAPTAAKVGKGGVDVCASCHAHIGK